MKLTSSERAWEDYQAWLEIDSKVVHRINQLVREIQRDPFRGIGKPEPLRPALQGYWSRRISDEHRIVYKIQDGAPLIAQLRYHY